MIYNEETQGILILVKMSVPSIAEPHRTRVPTTEQIANKSHQQFPAHVDFLAFKAKDWAGILGLRLPRQQGMNAIPALPLGL